MSERAPLELTERKICDAAKVVAPHVPDGWGFGLFMFSLGEGGYMTWVSNCKRTDVIKTLREWLAIQPEDRAEDKI